MDPKKRVTAEKALLHPWLRKDPQPQSIDLMPTFPALNEIAREERKKQKRQ